MLSGLYARVAAQRRRWYDRHPQARRRLARPVVSVGALAAGGRGKTPLAALVAELLRDAGERPAVLSRGYGRRVRADGVVVVRDAEAVRATVDTAGDEPLMLAERLRGVPVLVCDDRYLAGRLAEAQLGATVHVLDDGFQHLRLARDLDLLLVSADDLEQPTLPGGRLRERPATARLADALIVDAPDRVAAGVVADRFDAGTSFLMRRSLDAPRPVAGGGAADGRGAGRVLAVAGIAAPERFTAALTAAGFDLAGALTFADHHRFTPADVRRIADRASSLGVDLVLTTEKDAVRLAPHIASHAAPPNGSPVAPSDGSSVAPSDGSSVAPSDGSSVAPSDGSSVAPHGPFGAPLAAVPLRVAIEPADGFRTWLLERVAAAGDRR